MRITPALLVFAMLGLTPALASAQRVPFFGAAGTAYDPEISVVNSGEILDAQPVVSGDMKYVTINTRASSSRLQALRDFTFVGSGVRRGFVGGVGGGGRGGGGRDRANGAPARGRERGIEEAIEADADADADADAADAAPDTDAADEGRRSDGEVEKVPVAPRGRVAGVLDQPGMTLVGRFDH